MGNVWRHVSQAVDEDDNAKACITNLMKIEKELSINTHLLSKSEMREKIEELFKFTCIAAPWVNYCRKGIPEGELYRDMLGDDPIYIYLSNRKNEWKEKLLNIVDKKKNLDVLQD